MKPSLLLFSTVLAVASSAPASTLLIDFGRTDLQTLGNWNNVVPATTTLNNLIDSNGNIGSEGLTITDQFFQSAEPSTLGSEAPFGAAGIFPVSATDDYFFGHTTPFAGATPNLLGQVMLFNLNPNTLYSFAFFAGRTGVTDLRDARYTVMGANSNSVVLNASNNESEVARIFGIVPDGNNEIVINVEPGPGNDNVNGFYYLGLMQVDTRPIPEPSTALSLLTCSIAALLRRRRGSGDLDR